MSVEIPLRMRRDAANPVLSPSALWWDNEFVFNPAVIQVDGTIHMVYRAHGEDRFGRFGYAASRDGLDFERRDMPTLEGDISDPYERLGIEDPRAVYLDGWVYLTYTAASVEGVCPPHPRQHATEPPWRVRVAMARTRDFETWERFGVVIPEFNSKNAVLFDRKIRGRYALLHRRPPDIWIAYSDDLRHWTDHQVVMKTRDGMWDCKRIGAGPPPVRLEKGWLLFYHGIDQYNTYRAGAALLDPEDPARVVARLDDWLLQPEQEFEAHGWVGNVVFPTGIVERDGVFRIYYGGADRVICSATIARDEIEQALYAAAGV